MVQKGLGGCKWAVLLITLEAAMNRGNLAINVVLLLITTAWKYLLNKV